jgi:hypothetical protein
LSGYFWFLLLFVGEEKERVLEGGSFEDTIDMGGMASMIALAPNLGRNDVSSFSLSVAIPILLLLPYYTSIP